MLIRIFLTSLLSLCVVTQSYAVDKILSDSAMRRLVEARPGVAEQIGDGLDKILGYVDPATGVELVTVDQLVEQMKAGGVSTATMAELLKSYFTNTKNDDGSRKYTDEQVANAMVFSLVSGGVDADEAVRTTQSQVPDTTQESLATTLVEAQINFNLRVGVETTAAETKDARKTFNVATNTSSGSGSPLTVEEFIALTDNS